MADEKEEKETPEKTPEELKEEAQPTEEEKKAEKLKESPPVEREERFVPARKVKKLRQSLKDKDEEIAELKKTSKPSQVPEENLDEEIGKILDDESLTEPQRLRKIIVLARKGRSDGSIPSEVQREIDDLKQQVKIQGADSRFNEEFRQLLRELPKEKRAVARANKGTLRELAHTKRLKTTPLPYIFTQHEAEFQGDPKKKSAEQSKISRDKIDDTEVIWKGKTLDDILEMGSEQGDFIGSMDKKAYARFRKKMGAGGGWQKGDTKAREKSRK